MVSQPSLATIPRSVGRQITLANVPRPPKGYEDPEFLQSITCSNSIGFTLDTLIFPEQGDVLFIDGKAVVPVEAMEQDPQSVSRVFVYNKPPGVVSDAGPGTVLEGVVKRISDTYGSAVFPIGRLDKNTTGLLLFTNSGDVSNYINLPGIRVKTYIATYIGQAGKEPTEKQLDLLLNQGVDVSRPGDESTPDKIKLTAATLLSVVPIERPKLDEKYPKKYRYNLQVKISSGAFHIVKRMLHLTGFPPVKSLHRVAVGTFHLDENIEPGGVRELSKAEMIGAGVPSEQELLKLKLSQLLCRLRYGGCEDTKLEEYLLSHHTLDRPCFEAFPGLKCRWPH